MRRRAQPAAQVGPAPGSLAQATAVPAAAATAIALGAAALIVYVFGVRSAGYFFFDGSDIPVYFRYAQAIAAGARPYGTLAVEYPPLALPLFTLPFRSPSLGAYAERFAALMLLLSVAAAGLTAAAATAIAGAGAARRTSYLTAVAFGCALLSLGALVGNRYDAAVAFLLSAFLLFFARGALVVAAFILGLGFALKLTPALLLPLVLVTCSGRGELLRSCASFAIGAFAPFVPYLPESTAALQEVLAYHGARPLQLESVLAMPLHLGHVLEIRPAELETSFGSQNFTGDFARALALTSRALQPLLLALLYVAAWRRRVPLRSSPAARMIATTAVMLAFLVSAKVLSPQFFIWLLPFTALVLPTRPALGFLLLGAMLVTQVLFPARYLALMDLQTVPVLLLLLRNGLLLGAAALALSYFKRYEDRSAMARN